MAKQIGGLKGIDEFSFFSTRMEKLYFLLWIIGWEKKLDVKALKKNQYLKDLLLLNKTKIIYTFTNLFL